MRTFPEQASNPFVRISNGHGRHGKQWRVELIGGRGYMLVELTVRSSREAAMEQAAAEFGGMPYVVVEK